MKELTPSLVADFWAFMEERYDTTVLHKDDDLIKIIRAAGNKDWSEMFRNLTNLNQGDEIGLVALFLAKLGHIDVARFMERYTTTLGDRIYVPYNPGEATPEHSLKSQLLTCVHEHRHVKQFREAELHGMSFAIRYLADRAQRAIYEAEAFRAALEVEWFLSDGKLTEAQVLRRPEILVDYACEAADIEVAKQYLKMSFKTIKHGGSIDNIARVAVAWLRVRLED